MVAALKGPDNEGGAAVVQPPRLGAEEESGPGESRVAELLRIGGEEKKEGEKAKRPKIEEL